jgi:hypothetical protein
MVNPNWQVSRTEGYLARMLAFDFEPGVKAWRRACFAQGWYWTGEQYATLSGDREGPLVEPIAKTSEQLSPLSWRFTKARSGTLA